MKKTIILFFGMILLLNGVDLKSYENNESKKERKYLYKISKKVSLKKDGTERYLFTHTEVLNNKGQLLQDKREMEDFIWVNYYTYADNGKKIKKLSKNLLKPKSDTTTLYIYDNEGVLKETKTLDINGTVQSSREIPKDDDNNTKKEYNKDGKLIKKVKNTKSFFSQSNKVNDRKDAPYKPMKRIDYFKKEITTYSYDKVGNEIKKEFIERYDHIDKQVYNYDKEGNLLSENNSSENNQSIKEHYIIYKKYDVHNNLIKEYTKVLKSLSECRGGMGYETPNYDLVLSYNEENRIVQIDSDYRYIFLESVSHFKYRTTIHYEYDDELRF